MSKLVIRLFVIVVFSVPAVCAHNLRAQPYSSVHYDTRSGLPSNTVYDISQDKDGFIWFGTENGLCRFDGKNFRTFTTKDGLPDNSILRVHGDKTGRLYFNPFTHSLHYYKDGTFFKMPIPEKYKVDLASITVFFNQGNRVLMCGFANGYILENDQLLSLHDRFDGMPESAYLAAISDTLISATTADSVFLIGNSGKIRKYPRRYIDSNWVVLDDRKAQSLPPQKIILNGYSYIPDSLLYSPMGNIVRIYSSKTGELKHKITFDKLASVFVDNENNLWLATVGNGVHRFPSFNFRSIGFDGKSEIFSLLKANDRVLAGTDFSKMFSVPVNDARYAYSLIDLAHFAVNSPNTTTFFTGRNRIYSLSRSGDNIYIGADAFLLKQKGNAAPLFKSIFPVKDMDVENGTILACLGRSVLLLDAESLSVKDTLLEQRSTCGAMYHDEYYIGTLGGLIKINAATKQVTELFKTIPSFKGRITSIKRGIDDDLWIATSGFGLVHFKNGRVIRILKEADGLTSDICTSLFIDSTLVWLGTNKGLNRIETAQGKMGVTRFTSANGLGADFINTVIADQSNIYVGTASGLTVFDKNLLTEKSVCILHILQVSENNRPLKKESSYTFPHNALNIQIDFTAISFKSAGDITYYYMVEGLDQQWNTTTANFVNFPTLQPGGYTFLLKAVNKFGVESGTESVRITVLPPWWQTWVFRIISLFVLGMVVLLVYRSNIRSIKRKEEMKREFEARSAALEQKALQAQMNPHFIFNSLNSIQNFILNLDVEGANNYLTSFASLIRQTLDNSMQPLITIASELKYLETYLSLEKLRFRDKFRYEFQVDRSIDQNNTVLPAMLLQPYIENSMRHGIQHRKDNDGLIVLAVTKTEDGDVLYTITDNGVGRKKATELRSSRHIEYQSRGTFINEKRIAAINNQFKTNIRVNTGDIIDENGAVAGTTVTVLIPTIHKS